MYYQPTFPISLFMLVWEMYVYVDSSPCLLYREYLAVPSIPCHKGHDILSEFILENQKNIWCSKKYLGVVDYRTFKQSFIQKFS